MRAEVYGCQEGNLYRRISWISVASSFIIRGGLSSPLYPLANKQRKNIQTNKELKLKRGL